MFTFLKCYTGRRKRGECGKQRFAIYIFTLNLENQLLFLRFKIRLSCSTLYCLALFDLISLSECYKTISYDIASTPGPSKYFFIGYL